MKKLTVFFPVLLAAFLLQAKEVKLLTIGNSFADSAFVFLPKVASSVEGCSIVMERANHGGCELSRHWRYISEEESDSSVKNYNKRTLKEILNSRKWDFVTIQQASHESWKAESYQPYANNIIGYVNKNAPSAEVLIQQTWSYRLDCPRFKKWGISQKEMYERLTAAYLKLAKETNLRVIPTGYAVELARATQGYEFKMYDKALLKTLKWPDLPNQSGDLVGQMAWDKAKKGYLYINVDSIHLNDRGRYLQACVWFGFMFEKDPRLIKYVPKSIADKDAEFLRNVAYTALKDFKQPKND